MDATKGVAGPMYEDFVPTTELKQEKDSDTLLLNLPGFKKEQLRVQLTRGILRISGARPVGNNKWSRFQKEFPLSANCDTNKIAARFENGKLYVIQPKLITPADEHVQKLAPPKAPEAQKPADEPQAQNNGHEQASQKTSQKDEPNKQTAGAINVPEKTQEKVEERSKLGNSRGLVDDNKIGKESAQEMKTSIAEKSSEEKNTSNKDMEQKTSDKSKTDLANATGRKDNTTTGKEGGDGRTKLANYKDISGAMASRLKMPRRVMNAGLAALFTLLICLYVSNWIRSFRQAEN